MPEQFLHGVEVVEIDAGPRPIQTVKSSVIGIVGTAPDADPAAFPLNTPVLIAGSRKEAAKLDTVGDYAGTLPAALDAILDQCGAMVVVVRVEEGADETVTMTNVVGGVDGVTGQYEGVQALLASKSVLGFTPRILLAPGFTHQRPEDSENPGTYLKNPVAAELEGIAERMRAVILVDGPNTNDAAAIAAIGDYGTARVYMVDPWVKVYRNGAYANEPASARVAGVIARTDNDKGFWWSPSNKPIYGISGTSRPVDFTLGDANCRANALNEKKVATIINEGGYILWGNRTASTDSKWLFLSVRRTADMINESLLQAHMWAVDRNITKTYVQDVIEGVNAYLRHLKAVGAILGGSCWADPELNTPDQIAQGKVYFDFDFTPPYPAEHITFRSHLVNDYITEVFE
ncbi:phage tail sheath C-terminal domain-containing protein [Desulfovibrio psychrotolerans]|uniref:Bacteriophage protein n=1 Tax=Desulfovibrio psychrotolerans TaxID=415242 RepID=A0A7J0BYR0_9BACT|nr:phage tail sheath C-terminal domain-containing protein [Desulfovibrio psychrotolerans]GFM38325.1 bacteriophage protein [Desulfovibrio psychrotolerans]